MIWLGAFGVALAGTYWAHSAWQDRALVRRAPEDLKPFPDYLRESSRLGRWVSPPSQISHGGQLSLVRDSVTGREFVMHKESRHLFDMDDEFARYFS